MNGKRNKMAENYERIYLIFDLFSLVCVNFSMAMREKRMREGGLSGFKLLQFHAQALNKCGGIN